MEKGIDFDVLGIAETLTRNRLKVPPNQREYSWLRDAQVRDLLQDIANSMRQGNNPYFLGTVVLTRGSQDFLEIADGQQRLATTTIILAVIRDWFAARGEAIVVQGIEQDYLFTIDIKARARLPRLTLNLDDNEFFLNAILTPKEERQSMHPTRRSHKLISDAANEVREYFMGLEKQFGSSGLSDYLQEWIVYLKNNANIVKLTVLDAANAFVMFETLNDRGLKTSQADLVKNYLFGLAQDRLDEAQRHWSSMRGAVETVGNDDDLTMEFLKLSCCIMTGLTREREVMAKVETLARSKNDAIKLLVFFDELSRDYAAILNPDHQKWNEYDNVVRKSIQTINILGVTQIRPLMLAVTRYFSKAQTAEAFRKMVSWSVRFLVINIRGGRLDEGYSRLSNSIFKLEIKNDKDLKNSAAGIVISDAQFRTVFETARVSVSKLARYYLRSLETVARNQRDPELVPNEDIVINLEHVMPESLGLEWPSVDPQDAETHFARLGNMVLLQAEKNSKIGNSSFETKRKTYEKSAFLLTTQVAECTDWTVKEINDRQKLLAELAVKAWPL
jgi:hypothetical protein